MLENMINIFKFESYKESDEEKKLIIENSFGKSSQNSIFLMKNNKFWSLNKKYDKKKEISIKYKINKNEKDNNIFGPKFISNNKKKNKNNF